MQSGCVLGPAACAGMMINSLVVFRNGAFTLDGHKRLNQTGLVPLPTLDGCEVIGDIHDNPELLEVDYWITQVRTVWGIGRGCLAVTDRAAAPTSTCATSLQKLCRISRMVRPSV